jgi:hypothetical protein
MANSILYIGVLYFQLLDFEDDFHFLSLSIEINEHSNAWQKDPFI